MKNGWRRTAVGALAMVVAAATAATATAATVGTSFPAGFPVIQDASLGVPMLGFGAAGPVHRTPVILLHGNNDTAYPGACNPYGQVHSVAQYLADHGYAPSELWGLGYQGDQCDALVDPTVKSSYAHSTVANIPDLDRFVRAVLAYTGAKRVDVVGHSLGVTLTRAWMKSEHTGHLVRRLVAIDGPNHGIVDCSPSPANYFQLPAFGGFTPVERDLPGVRLARLAVPPLAEQGPGDAGADAVPRDPEPRTGLRLRLGAGRVLPGGAGRGQRRSAARLLRQRDARRRGRADLDRPGRVRPVPRHEPSGDPRVADDLGRDARVPDRRQVGARGRADHLQRRRPSTATQAVAES